MRSGDVAAVCELVSSLWISRVASDRLPAGGDQENGERDHPLADGDSVRHLQLGYRLTAGTTLTLVETWPILIVKRIDSSTITETTGPL